MTQAEAAELQAWATVLLVVLTGVYLIFVYRQSSAAQESTKGLVRRDLKRQHAQLSMLFAAMMSLQWEGQRWLEMEDLRGDAYQGTLAEDFFRPDSPGAIRDAAAAGSLELNEAVWQTMDSAREARHALSRLRRMSGDKSNPISETVKKLRQCAGDVYELAMQAASIAQQEADEIEIELQQR